MQTIDSNQRVEAAELETTHPVRREWMRAEIVFLGCLAAAAFLVRLWPIWQVHFWDEAVYLQNAEVICCAKSNYSELSSRPPLLSLLFAAVFKLWHHAYAASVLTALLNALGPILLYVAGRRLVGKAGAGLAAMLFAFSPFLVSSNTGNSLLTDSPALTLIVLAFWLLLVAGENASPLWFGLAGFVSAMAVLMRFASLPTVAVLALLVFRAPQWLRAAVWFVAGFVIGFGPYLLWSKLRYGGFLATLTSGWAKFRGAAEPASYYLENFGVIFPWITAAGLVLWVARWFVRREKPGAWRDTALILWAWALVAFAYFSALSHKELRYILPLAPPLFLLAGQGLTLLLPADRRRRIIGMVVLAGALGYSFAPTFARFQGPLISPFISEEKEVSDFLESKAAKGAILYTNFNSPVFGYYTHLPTRVLQEYGSFHKAFPENMPSDGYLILYKEVDEEPRLDWAESDPHFRRFQDFPSLVVYEYRVTPVR